MKNSLYLFRIKAIFADRLTCIIMILFTLLFMLIIHNLSINSGERSSIPIGMLNLDHSISADELMENIKGIPAFYIYEGSESELKDLLYKEEIRAYFIIKDGYEKKIQSGNTDELITMDYLEEDESAKILSDIIAGEMLYKICLYKGYNLYHSLPPGAFNINETSTATKSENRLSEKEYMDYAKSLLLVPDFNFAFDIKMKDIKNQSFEGEIDNSILYLQAIWGIVAMLLSFTAMLMTAGAVLEKQTGIRQRVKISLLKSYSMDLSHFGAAFTIQSILAVVLCIVLMGRIQNLTVYQGGLLFLTLELFSVLIISWFILLGKFVTRADRYQFIGLLSILVFGLFGFLYIMTGFMDNKILIITKIIPNYWFIEEFTDIILNKNLRDITATSYIKFLTTACGLLGLNGLISKRQYR